MLRKYPTFMLAAILLVHAAAIVHISPANCGEKARGGIADFLAGWGGDDTSEDDDTQGWGDDQTDDDDGDVWGLSGSRKGSSGGSPRKGSAKLPPQVEGIRTRAEKGDEDSQFEMGRIYANGLHGVPVDYDQASRWYEMAIKQGSIAAMINLGVIYIEHLPDDGGRQRKQQFKKGYEYLTTAAEEGSMLAQYNLGIYYRDGRGVPADVDKAIKWLSMAAEQGEPDGCNAVSLLYYNMGDFERAGYWFLKGAEAKQPTAAFNAGVFYENGQGGFPENQEMAFHFFHAAAELGNPGGMRSTGIRYLYGVGVEADLPRAKKWLLLAKGQGVDDADKYLSEIPADIQAFDDSPLKATAKQLIEEFRNDSGAAQTKYRDHMVEITGGDTSVSMIDGKATVVVSVERSPVTIKVEVVSKQKGVISFDYGEGRAIRARFAGFANNVILLDNGETVDTK